MNGNKTRNGNGSLRLPVFIDWVFRFLAFLMIPTLIWAVKLEIRLTTIEHTQFTTQDGLNVWKELEKRPTRDQTPPAWLLEDIWLIQRKIERLEDNSHRDN